jgi:hypothetical protein
MARADDAAADDDARGLDIDSDTADYCQDLLRIIDSHERRLPEVDRLAEEGREMCARGEIRGGILRLRSAVLLINGNADGPK